MSIDVLNSALGFLSRRINQYVSVSSEDPSIDEVTITIMRLSEDDVADVIRRLEALPNV
jgi:hypothetical protein